MSSYSATAGYPSSLIPRAMHDPELLDLLKQGVTKEQICLSRPLISNSPFAAHPTDTLLSFSFLAQQLPLPQRLSASSSLTPPRPRS